MMTKQWNFCVQILQAVPILQKKFHLYFFSALILLLPKIFSTLIFHSVIAFQWYQVLKSFWIFTKSLSFEKLIEWILNSTLVRPIVYKH